MDFGLSDDQSLLQDVFRSFLSERVPVARVREVSRVGAPALAGLWTELVDLGAAGVLIPEEFGGSGLHLLDAALIAAELGHAVTPAPFLGSAVMAPVALLEAGTPEQQREWLPALATGAARTGIAITETYASLEGASVQLEGERLRGRALMASNRVRYRIFGKFSCGKSCTHC